MIDEECSYFYGPAGNWAAKQGNTQAFHFEATVAGEIFFFFSVLKSL